MKLQSLFSSTSRLPLQGLAVFVVFLAVALASLGDRAQGMQDNPFGNDPGAAGMSDDPFGPDPFGKAEDTHVTDETCLLYTSPSPRDS